MRDAPRAEEETKGAWRLAAPATPSDCATGRRCLARDLGMGRAHRERESYAAPAKRPVLLAACMGGGVRNDALDVHRYFPRRLLRPYRHGPTRLRPRSLDRARAADGDAAGDA